MKIRKGDTVKVLYGKDRDRRGKVLRVLRSKNQVVVDDLNVYKKHIKGDGKGLKSEIIAIIKPMPLSKVMLVCPVCEKVTRVGMTKVGKQMVRVCKKCNKRIDQVGITEKKSVKKKKGSKKKKAVKVGAGRGEKGKKETQKVSGQVVGHQSQQRARSSGER